MELPDFLQFDPLNSLRQAMGAERLGHFEFFDPHLHLTADERGRLSQGMEIGWSQLRCLHDYSLTYKNSRVLLVPAGSPSLMPTYHLAWCRTLQNLRAKALDQRLWIATVLADESQHQVCGECLQQLQFQGYDGARSRHREYSERIRAGFRLADFYQRYPVYPVATDALQQARPVSDVSASFHPSL